MRSKTATVDAGAAVALEASSRGGGDGGRLAMCNINNTVQALR